MPSVPASLSLSRSPADRGNVAARAAGVVCNSSRNSSTLSGRGGRWGGWRCFWESIGARLNAPSDCSDWRDSLELASDLCDECPFSLILSPSTRLVLSLTLPCDPLRICSGLGMSAASRSRSCLRISNGPGAIVSNFLITLAPPLVRGLSGPRLILFSGVGARCPLGPRNVFDFFRMASVGKGGKAVSWASGRSGEGGDAGIAQCWPVGAVLLRRSGVLRAPGLAGEKLR